MLQSVGFDQIDSGVETQSAEVVEAVGRSCSVADFAEQTKAVPVAVA